MFAEDSLDQFLRQNTAAAAQAVESISEQEFGQTETEKIVEHILSRFEVSPLVLLEDQKVMDHEEVQVDVTGDPLRHFRDERGPHYVRGVRITVSIPYTGDMRLWQYRTNPFNWNPPRAHIRSLGRDSEGGHLDIVLDLPVGQADNVSNINQRIGETLNGVTWFLQQSWGQVQGYNQNLRTQVCQIVENRRTRLGKRFELAKALNIPLRQNLGAPDVTQLTMKKRIVKSLPTKPNAPTESAINDHDYENILRIIRHEGRTFETTPDTYAIHDEEGLRNIILAHLNGHYEGDATGETFRRAGKTDIRIEDRSRAAFVAECKVWRGPNEITEAVDQLLRYLTWRDCKAALVIFNQKVAEFAGIQTKLPDVLSGHAQSLSKISVAEVGEWRFKLRSTDDPDRIVTVHVFLFNLYVARSPRRRRVPNDRQSRRIRRSQK